MSRESPALVFFCENQALSWATWAVGARKRVRLLAPCAAASAPRVPRVLATRLPVAEQLHAPVPGRPWWPQGEGRWRRRVRQTELRPVVSVPRPTFAQDPERVGLLVMCLYRLAAVSVLQPDLGHCLGPVPEDPDR